MTLMSGKITEQDKIRKGYKYDGYLSISENNDYVRSYQVPFSSDWLDLMPEAFFNYLKAHTQENGGP